VRPRGAALTAADVPASCFDAMRAGAAPMLPGLHPIAGAGRREPVKDSWHSSFR
jgi:hypothetical protein